MKAPQKKNRTNSERMNRDKNLWRDYCPKKAPIQPFQSAVIWIGGIIFKKIKGNQWMELWKRLWKKERKFLISFTFLLKLTSENQLHKKFWNAWASFELFDRRQEINATFGANIYLRWTHGGKPHLNDYCECPIHVQCTTYFDRIKSSTTTLSFTHCLRTLIN